MDTLSLFQKYLQSKDIDVAFISSPVNISYLTGFRGVYPPSVLVGYFFNPDGFLIVPRRGKSKLIVDGRYAGAEFDNKENVNMVIYSGEGKQTMVEFCAELIINKNRNRKNIGLEKLYLTYKEGAKLIKLLSGNGIKDISDVILNQRSIKTDEEIVKLKKAVKITDDTFSYIIEKIKPGLTESEIGLMIEQSIKDKGGEISFPPIIASGKNSSIPHYDTGGRKISKRDIILLDFGAKYMGYHADMTRTVFYGEPTSKQKVVYNAVLEAQVNAEDCIMPEMPAKVAFKYATDVLEKHDLREYFSHSLSHGVGLFIHELPKINSKNSKHLKEGNVFSVEPGVYLTGEFGVRIEDLAWLRANGCDVLTQSQKELTVLK